MEEQISKNLKLLMLLGELGISGTANLLSNYKKRYRNDTMSRKVIAVVMDYYSDRSFVRKKYNRLNKQFWGNNPQIYELTKGGKSYLRNKALSYNLPLVIT